jgi:hypothetical protein
MKVAREPLAPDLQSGGLRGGQALDYPALRQDGQIHRERKPSFGSGTMITQKPMPSLCGFPVFAVQYGMDEATAQLVTRDR